MSEDFGRWRQSGLAWLPLTALVIALDQLSKAWILRVFELSETKVVLPLLDIIHAHNPGAAFSFLAGADGWQRWFFTAIAMVVSVVILFWMRRLDRSVQALQCAAFALIMGGALGNVIDRLQHGFVIDFIAVHWKAAYFPAFNVADSCITIGAGLIILDALLESRRTKRVT
jgi:signal peptidase II